MTNHPNRNWCKRWTVDLSTCTASHESGLVVEFILVDKGTWDGDVIQLPPSLDTGQLPRLMCEAGYIYKEALDKRQ